MCRCLATRIADRGPERVPHRAPMLEAMGRVLEMGEIVPRCQGRANRSAWIEPMVSDKEMWRTIHVDKRHGSEMWPIQDSARPRWTIAARAWPRIANLCPTSFHAPHPQPPHRWG